MRLFIGAHRQCPCALVLDGVRPLVSPEAGLGSSRDPVEQSGERRSELVTMAHWQRDVRAAVAAAGTALRPSPRQLAELGTVLCLYRPEHGGELVGWQHAVRTESATRLDGKGLQESLSFFDACGQCCWRLFLLPDSDFLAWDLLASQFPSRHVRGIGGSVAYCLRRLLAKRAGGSWRVCVLRVRELSANVPVPMLVASPTRVSALGAAAAHRIALREGADGEFHWMSAAAAIPPG